MGLAISVGYLAKAIGSGQEEWAGRVRGVFQQVRQLLADKGLPVYEEPEGFERWPQLRPHVGSFPYENMRCLRRLLINVIYHRKDPDSHPVFPRRRPEDIAAAQQWIADRHEYWFSDHLLVHSVYSGLYLPVDFPDPLLSGDGIPGEGFVCSSHQLLAELSMMAPALGVELANGVLTDAEHAKLWESLQSGQDPWDPEKCAWLALWENATASVEHSTAVWFH